MPNLTQGSKPREFWVWVNPEHKLAKHNLGLIGSFWGGPLEPGKDNPQSLMFLPNSQFIGNVISPFHLGVINDYRIEYHLEFIRYQNFASCPSRFFSLFLLDNVFDAHRYYELHLHHVGDRVLKRGVTTDDFKYSVHDATFIDFLRLPHGLDQTTMNTVADAYWRGASSEDCALSSMGEDWRQLPCREVLFYGRLDFPNSDLSVSDA